MYCFINTVNDPYGGNTRTSGLRYTRARQHQIWAVAGYTTRIPDALPLFTVDFPIPLPERLLVRIAISNIDISLPESDDEIASGLEWNVRDGTVLYKLRRGSNRDRLCDDLRAAGCQAHPEE